MHILYFHFYFNTRDNPGGTRSYEMAKRLLDKGHIVTIVCGSRYGNLKLEGEYVKGIRRGNIDGIDIIEIYLPNFDYENFIKRAISFIRYGIRSIKVALTHDYDLLFATSTPLTAGIPGIIMKYFRKKPFVFEVRDLWPELPKAMGVIKNPVILRMLSFLEWLSYRKADACIGLSPGIVEGIKKRSRDSLPVIMIPNSCDLDLFRPDKKGNISYIDGIDENDFVAVFTGAHGMANGLDAVLDAAFYLKSMQVDRIKFLFIGRGMMKRKLQERARRHNLDNCVFHDPIPKNRLSYIVATADVGLMILANVPAFYYGTSPNKFFDYLAGGLPVLNNYPGWVADMIEKYECGIAVEPGNAKDFAEALVWLHENPEKRKKMGENARRLAESHFDRNHLSSEFSGFLEKTYREYYQEEIGNTE